MPAPIGEGVLRSERLQARPVEGEREFPVAYLRGGVGVVQAHIVSGVFNGVAPYGGFPVNFLAGKRGGTGEGRDNRKADGGESNANFHFLVSTPVSRFLQALSIFWQAGFQLDARSATACRAIPIWKISGIPRTCRRRRSHGASEYLHARWATTIPRASNSSIWK